MSKVLPRFELHGVLPKPAQYAEPLPPTLLALLGEQAAQHEQLAGRYEAATGKVAALTLQLEREHRADAARERQALATGAKVPPQKAPKVSEQLVEATRQADVLADLLKESAAKLLRASVEHVGAARDQAELAVQAAVEEAEDLAAAALAAMERASLHSAEVGWFAGLHAHGVVPTWTTGVKADPSPRASALLAALGPAFEEDRYQLAKRREDAERERALDDKAVFAAGTRVWRMGREYIADAEGVLQEVEVER